MRAMISTVVFDWNDCYVMLSGTWLLAIDKFLVSFVHSMHIHIKCRQYRNCVL